MGAYLTAPNKDIESETGHGNGLKYAAGSMQGWRRSQEDAHVACPELLAALPEFEKFDDEYIARVRSMSAFGVFDGHGGKEVSMFVSDFILKELFQSKHFQDYNIEQALTHLFHSLDDLLCDPVSTVIDDIYRLNEIFLLCFLCITYYRHTNITFRLTKL